MESTIGLCHLLSSAPSPTSTYCVTFQVTWLLLSSTWADYFFPLVYVCDPDSNGPDPINFCCRSKKECAASIFRLKDEIVTEPLARLARQALRD